VMQQILRKIQLDVGPDQIVSARLLPAAVDEAESNGSANGKAAKVAAAAAAIAGVDAE